TIFSSFVIETLVEIASACDRPSLWLVNPAIVEAQGIGAAITLARDHGVRELGINIDQSSHAIRDGIFGSGLAFGCWGAHSEAQIDKALDLEAKVFTSDRPSPAIARRALWTASHKPVNP